jgi:hypothetical protein
MGLSHCKRMQQFDVKSTVHMPVANTTVRRDIAGLRKWGTAPQR